VSFTLDVAKSFRNKDKIMLCNNCAVSRELNARDHDCVGYGCTCYCQQKDKIMVQEMRHKLLVKYKNSKQLSTRINSLEKEGWILLFVVMWRDEYVALLRQYVPDGSIPLGPSKG